MRSKKVMKNTLTILLLIWAFTANAGQEGGGGGDSNSRENRLIRSYFNNNAEMIRKDLIAIFANVKKFTPVGNTSALMHDLISRGVLEDIKRTTYSLQIVCYDENGIERSASTKKVDISNDLHGISPDICVNVRKLAMEKATYQSIVGLLVHEHSRHFGEDDTDEFGLHPLADYVTEKYSSLVNIHISKAVALDGFVLPVQVTEENLRIIKVLSTQRDVKVDLVVDDITGWCKKLRMRYNVKVKKGDRIQLSEKNSLVFFELDGTPLFTGNKDCHVTYHFEIKNHSSPAFTAILTPYEWPNWGKDSQYRYIQFLYFSDYNDLEY